MKLLFVGMGLGSLLGYALAVLAAEAELRRFDRYMFDANLAELSDDEQMSLARVRERLVHVTGERTLTWNSTGEAIDGGA